VGLPRPRHATHVAITLVVAAAAGCEPAGTPHDEPSPDAAAILPEGGCSAPITCPSETLCLQLLAGCTDEGSGSADGVGSAAGFNFPGGVAVDPAGDVYASDTLNNAIRKITPAGVVSTVAGSMGDPGSVDGIGSAALFNQPGGLAIDGAGNVYVADQLNNTVRMLTPAGVVTTYAGSAGVGGSADGLATAALFNVPSGVTVDSAGNLYVADYGNFTIRQVSPTGTVTTLAGSPGQIGHVDGAGSAAQFEAPTAVAVDRAGNVYVADMAAIRKITPAGVVTTLAGNAYAFHGSADGVGSAAQFDEPMGLAVDANGNVYVADSQNAEIRRVTPAGVVTTIAGVASQHGIVLGTSPRFSLPVGVALSGDALVIADGGFIPPSAAILTLENGMRSLETHNGEGLIAGDDEIERQTKARRTSLSQVTIASYRAHDAAPK
jgi:sugar lactone lactonase YvrE